MNYTLGTEAANLDLEPSLSPAHRALYDAGDRTQDFSTYIFLPIKTTLESHSPFLAILNFPFSDTVARVLVV